MARTSTTKRDPRRSPRTMPTNSLPAHHGRCAECEGELAAARGYCFSCGRIIPFADEYLPVPSGAGARTGQPTAHA